ncbi:hypothetical protein ACGFIP_32250 [Micromonospora zamorensis]|uniref:hypothetical protein n=1 Tax=Micromonospora zamorensis TaxID=709883 RepID=UPI00371BB434
MARLIGPDEGSREVRVIVGGAFRAMPNRTVTMYADEAASVLADIRTLAGATIVGSVVATDMNSMLALFQFPDGDVDVVYGKSENGPVWPIYARTDDRLDQLKQSVGGVSDAAAAASAAAAAAAATAAAANTVASAALPRTLGKNLFDKDSALPNTLWTSTGTTISLGGFNAGPKIPVVAGQQYTINNARGILRWTTGGAFSSYVDNASEAPYTFTVAAGIGFVSYSVQTAKAGVSQMEAGASVTSYEAYGILVPRQVVNGQPLTEAVATVTSMSSLPRLPALQVYRTGDNLAIRSAFDADRDVIHPLTLNYGSAGCVGFYVAGVPQVTLVPNTATDAEVWPVAVPTGYRRIHDVSDDNCPIQIGWSYVGGNHGYSVGTQIAQVGHGKTTADLGSQWTDGVRTFTLLAITNANTLLFGNSYATASGISTGTTGLPAAPLTHVSGATNTTTVPIASITTPNVQIFPSLHSRTVTMTLDGRAIPEGKSYGDLLLVDESYVIPSYKGLIDTAQASIGVPMATYLPSTPSLARVSNSYRFTRATLVVGQKVTMLERSTLNQGVTQMFPLTLPAGGGTRRQFMAGVGTVGALNLSTYATIDSLAAQADIVAASQRHPLHPPARMTQWSHDAGGNAQYGVALGYLPALDAHPAVRLRNFSPRGWFISSSLKKNYPQLRWGVTAEIGDSTAGTAYRRYLAPTAGLPAEFVVSDGTDQYVVIDRPDTVTDARMVVPPELLGRRLVPVYQPNTVTVPDRVTAEGIPYSVPAGPGYGMWRAERDDARLETIPGATSQAGSFFVVSQGAVSTYTLTAGSGVLYLHPMYLPDAVTVDRACVEVTTLGTGVLRHGVYANDPATGLPVAVGPLADFGTIDVSSAGVKESTLAPAVTLPAGWHWYGWVWQGSSTTAPTMRTLTAGGGTGPLNIGTSSALMSATRSGYTASPVTGALGAITVTPANAHQLAAPRVAYRRA